MRAPTGDQMGLPFSPLFQGFQTPRFKMPTFNNLQELVIKSSDYAPILPPPEFLSSITSTHLSYIIIDITGEESDRVLDAIEDYDEALCQLANQLDLSSSGGEKLLLTLLITEELADPATVLPRFSELGSLMIEVMGTCYDILEANSIRTCSF